MNILLISLQNNLNIIGLKYLHYCLLEKGYKSFLFFLPNFNKDDIPAMNIVKDFVRQISPRFIGISLMSHEFFAARNLSAYLKQNFESIPIIWGGIHPTIAPEACLGYADYCLIGEGERSILDIANASDRNESMSNINNLCYRENGTVKRNQLYPLIENLDEVPLCNQIPEDSFLQEKNGRILSLNADKTIYKKYARYKGTIYDVITSRGCPFSCTYCCNNFVSRLYNSRKIRRRSIPDIILELEKAIEINPDIEYINFHDDCFLACNNDYLEEFCKSYREKINKPFIARSIPIYVNRNKIKSLRDAGLSWISLGLQSGSDRVCRDVYKRNSLKSDFLNVSKIIKDFNIAAFYDVILDNPFEGEADSLETIQTLMETPKPFQAQFFSLTLYMGTELYERAKKECPREIDDCLEKDYGNYRNCTINAMIRMAVFLNKKYMQKIIFLYKKNPQGINFKINLLIAKLLSSFIFEPITYFRVIKLSQRGSYRRTFKILPNYFKVGLRGCYLKQFNNRIKLKCYRRNPVRDSFVK